MNPQFNPLIHLQPTTLLATAAIGYVGYSIWKFQFGRGDPVTRGSARWLNTAGAEMAGMFLPRGLLIGDRNRWSMLPMFYNGDSNALVIGAPGTMKGTGVLIPNALRSRFMFLFDPGGEISAVCIAEWKRKGCRINIVNPWELHPDRIGTVGFNPLAHLDPVDLGFIQKIETIAKLTMDDRMTSVSDHAYFTTMAENGIKALIIFAVLSGESNLVYVRRLIRATGEKQSEMLLDMMKCSNALVREKAGEWIEQRKSDPKAFLGVLTTMDAATSWIDNSQISRCLTADTPRMDDVKGWDARGKHIPGAIFGLIMPQTLVGDLAPFARLYIASIVHTMGNGRLPRSRVLMMIDELPLLGKLNILYENLNTLRRRNMWFLLVAQSVGQFFTRVGQDWWAEIQAGCGLIMCVGSDDSVTSEFFSKQSGQATVIEESPEVDQNGKKRKSYIARPLITPHEVALLGKRQQLVLVRNKRPAKIAIRPYWEWPTLAGRFSTNPYYAGRQKGLPLTWPLQVVLGLLVRFLSGLGVYAGLVAVAGYVIWRSWT